MKTLTTLLLLFLFAGCYQPSGGGMVHKPPDGIERNQPTDLIVGFSVWGAGSGRLDKRYTDVICIYRINDSETHRLSGTVESASESNMEMKFTIPPLDLKEGDTVTYSFDVLFDKHRSVRNGGTLGVKK
jgi:hypothetical protein